MTTLYIDPSCPKNGDGSAANPFNTFDGVTWAPGNRYRCKRGTAWTGAFQLGAAGTPGNDINVEAYFYPNGSDEPDLPRPIIVTTGPVNTYATARNRVNFKNMDLRSNVLPSANDVALLWLGNDSSIIGCAIDSNMGGVYACGKNNVRIEGNDIVAAKAGAFPVNCISVGDTKNMDNIVIAKNRIIFGGGDNKVSHAIRVETGGGAWSVTGLTIEENTITPPIGALYTTNHSAYGLRLARCPGAKIRGNKISGMTTGIFVTGGGAVLLDVLIAGNDCSRNLNFGICLTTDTHRFLVEKNTCNYNGTDSLDAHAYGRGIEITSAAGQGRAGNHVVRFNRCIGNINFGGPLDNASEGVGIGLDDGTTACYVYGNYLANNEGNGLQTFGADNKTDAGGHVIVGNIFRNNGIKAVKGRRAGATTRTAFTGVHIGLGRTFGAPSVVANNVFMGGKVGILEGADCNNVTKANNIFIDVENGIGIKVGYGCTNNLFWWSGTPGKSYCGTAFDNYGLPAYPAIAYVGKNDLSFDPMLGDDLSPRPASPVAGAGAAVGVFNDQLDRPFKAIPSLGAFEIQA